MKDTFSDTDCKQPDTVLSGLFNDELIMCHIMKDNLVVTFHPGFAHLLDENLIAIYRTVWREMQPVLRGLEKFGVAPCHPDSK